MWQRQILAPANYRQSPQEIQHQRLWQAKELYWHPSGIFFRQHQKIHQGDYPDAISEIRALMKNHINNVEQWMNSHLGLFDGMSANQVLNLGEEGLTAVKSAVMRMP